MTCCSCGVLEKKNIGPNCSEQPQQGPPPTPSAQQLYLSSALGYLVGGLGSVFAAWMDSLGSCYSLPPAPLYWLQPLGQPWTWCTPLLCLGLLCLCLLVPLCGAVLLLDIGKCYWYSSTSCPSANYLLQGFPTGVSPVICVCVSSLLIFVSEAISSNIFLWGTGLHLRS